ncbi:exonuclease domain-containing protein [Leifsonia aquatica]|uniref:exonuclease domain-containing protein n=1 Tax=Leifsonia aquatica TaxID=144185 RepID=UPI000469F5CD|nr:exonuclease domain-containing protein [Leifsonia aquatica]
MIDFDLGVFDLETTGTDPLNDRIVTAYFGLLGPDGNIIREQEWIVDPGIPIPDGAAEVHGWTKERLDADPRTRRDIDAVVTEIGHLIYAICGGALVTTPLAGHNLAYDCTMLDAHLVRAGSSPLPYGPHFGGSGINVLDSIVLDRHFAKYIKGSGQRKLVATAARYGIQLSEEEAHAANFDAIASGRITQAIIRKHLPHLAGAPDLRTSLSALHGQQIGWRAEDQASLQNWLRTKGNEPTAVCEPEWPTHYLASLERNAA